MKANDNSIALLQEAVEIHVHNDFDANTKTAVNTEEGTRKTKKNEILYLRKETLKQKTKLEMAMPTMVCCESRRGRFVICEWTETGVEEKMSSVGKKAEMREEDHC